MMVLLLVETDKNPELNVSVFINGEKTDEQKMVPEKLIGLIYGIQSLLIPTAPYASISVNYLKNQNERGDKHETLFPVSQN